MPTLREAIWPILAIIVAAVIVLSAIAPLDSSEWAESIRAGNSVAVEGEPAEDFEAIAGILTIIAPLLKITALMGVPGLITLAILRITRRFGKRSAAGAAPG